MYENILVPLDGSKTGETALPYVEELVSKLTPKLKVKVTLFQVVPSMGAWVDLNTCSTASLLGASHSQKNLLSSKAQ